MCFIIQTFFEIADSIGFLKEDLASQNIQGKINVINEMKEVGKDASMSLRNKIGGYYFGDIYIYSLTTITNSIDILAIGNIVLVTSVSNE